MRILITGGSIVNEGRVFRGSLSVADDCIESVMEGDCAPRGVYDKEIDATGCFVLPGVIDDHVHFREPGLTGKADIASESRAAAYGGVTSYFEMPNTNPQTTSLEALDEKFALAGEKSHVNYSFFFGATNHNTYLFERLDRHRIPGIKLFMGSSTGGMLVDKQQVLAGIFQEAKRLDLPLMTHCEDTATITANMAKARENDDDPPIRLHPKIRSEQACYASTELAVQLARQYGTRLHVAHLTTARELELFGTDSNITAEAVIAHLMFSDADYERLGTLIKCNPAVKTAADRDALRQALTDGRITIVGTDHAPHLLSDKQGGCRKAASGMPMIQFSLVSMLQLVDEGVLDMPQLVALMCHNPARLFSVCERGFLRQGYKADVAIVRPNVDWTVTEDCIQSKCGWSPLLGHRFHWRVEHTLCNGRLILDGGKFDADVRGEALAFRN
uniref:Dihydroorotase n=1 Tax=Prevotella sp. GTC17253 TaxID=3236793 RepID=A0AB33IRI4_9BACT